MPAKIDRDYLKLKFIFKNYKPYLLERGSRNKYIYIYMRENYFI